jgi:hypothetical protein
MKASALALLGGVATLCLSRGTGRADNIVSSVEVHHAVRTGVSSKLKTIWETGYAQRMQEGVVERDQGYPRIPRPFRPLPPERLPQPNGSGSPPPPIPIAKLLNFEGNGNGLPNFQVTVAPPDTNGMPGDKQYVQWVNLAFSVWDKKTGIQVGGPFDGSSLWSNFGGPCSAHNDGDPIAHYDQLADRWVLTQFEVSEGLAGTGPFAECVAVSQTDDAMGLYNLYEFDFTVFNDYPKLGLWPDAYYMSYNSYDLASGAAGPMFCAMDRLQMIAGNPAATEQCFSLNDPNQFGDLPADLEGAGASYVGVVPSTALPPVGTPNPFVGADLVSQNHINFWNFHVDFTNPANSTLNGATASPFPITQLAVPPFNIACTGDSSGRLRCIPQAGTSNTVESLSGHMMYRAAYRKVSDGYGVMVLNQTVDVSATPNGQTGINWYRVVDPEAAVFGPALRDTGTQKPDASYRWMGSIAQDRAFNIALGYSVSSPALHPSIRYAVNWWGDPSGTLEPEQTLFAGTGSELVNGRWGDYSTMAVDPVDDCTFWFTQEYFKTNTALWNTRIGSFKLPACEPGVATFSIGNVTLTEGGNAVLTVERQGSLVGDMMVSFSTSDITALAGTDYAPTSGVLTFKSNVATQTITVHTLVEGTPQVGGNKLFAVSLKFPQMTQNQFQGAVLGAFPTVLVKIVDDDQPGTIQIAAPSYTIKKTGSPQSLVVTVTRSGGSAGGVSVGFGAFSTFSGHARPGTDFNETSGTLNFGPGVMTQTFNVQILAAGPPPPDVIPEDFEIKIFAPAGGAVLGRSLVTGNITEPIPPTTMQFAGTSGLVNGLYPEYHAVETTHSTNVTVTRAGPTGGPSSVQLSTFDVTATAGNNYVAINQVLNFLPGQTSKIVPIPILDPETINSASIAFGVLLSKPVGGVINVPVPPYPASNPGFAPIALVVIGQDVDTAGRVQFSSASYPGFISTGTASIALTRTGGTAANTSASVRTFDGDGTAIAGTDYVSFSGDVTFGAFQTSASFPITILPGATAGGTITVLLDSVNNGGALGAPSRATVTIGP